MQSRACFDDCTSIASLCVKRALRAICGNT